MATIYGHHEVMSCNAELSLGLLRASEHRVRELKLKFYTFFYETRSENTSNMIHLGRSESEEVQQDGVEYVSSRERCFNVNKRRKKENRRFRIGARLSWNLTSLGTTSLHAPFASNLSIASEIPISNAVAPLRRKWRIRIVSKLYGKIPYFASSFTSLSVSDYHVEWIF